MNGMSDILVQVKEYVEQLLTEDLPSNIYYHKLSHADETVEAVNIIGKHEKISKEDIEILELSAWFHDTGFVSNYEGHEEVSKSIAAAFLGSRKYPKIKINMVTACIEATKMPQKPINHLQKILCDADLYHLAQSDYWKKNEILKKEMEQCFHTHYRGKEWLLQNLNFLKEHHYFTAYGKEVLEPKKKQHLDENVKMLEEVTFSHSFSGIKSKRFR